PRAGPAQTGRSTAREHRLSGAVDAGVTTDPTFEFPAPPPLSLYIHLPWCVRKRPYCDFNSHALRGELPGQACLYALLRDLDDEAERAGNRPARTICIAGGTPSVFSAEASADLFRAVRRSLNLAADA